MAKFTSRPDPKHDPASEIKTSEALAALSDDWTIFHSVGWLGLRGNRVGDGEADFVLLNPSIGLIVLEVKGGGIELHEGRWRSIDRRGRPHDIKDPYRQATESKVGLHKWMRDCLKLNVPTAHAVVFPDISNLPAIGPHAPPEITIDARDFVRMRDKIDEVVSKWRISCALSPTDATRVIEALSPKMSVRRTLADEAFDASRDLIELTLEQIRAFGGLRRVRRAAVYGGAGTGKTVLAIEKARDFRDRGESALLVCYNDLLSNKLASDPSLKGVRVTTFHSLCLSQMRKAGREIPASPTPEWWDEAAALELVEALGATGDTFDAVVVDEGQDFRRSWIEALEAAGTTGADTPFYVFADENQILWPRDWTPGGDWFAYELTINCRNTREIAERLVPICNTPVPPEAARGPKAMWTELVREEKPDRRVQDIVCELLEEGFSPQEITVLCEEPDLVHRLRQSAVADTTFCGVDQKGVAVETIGRFKGLESQAVVVVLTATAETPDRMAYVGFSRARTYLRVLAPPSRREAVAWR